MKFQISTNHLVSLKNNLDIGNRVTLNRVIVSSGYLYATDGASITCIQNTSLTDLGDGWLEIPEKINRRSKYTEVALITKDSNWNSDLVDRIKGMLADENVQGHAINRTKRSIFRGIIKRDLKTVTFTQASAKSALVWSAVTKCGLNTEQVTCDSPIFNSKVSASFSLERLRQTLSFDFDTLEINKIGQIVATNAVQKALLMPVIMQNR
jgi:hypothetical protein